MLDIRKHNRPVIVDRTLYRQLSMNAVLSSSES
jgi:hypothetical protein